MTDPALADALVLDRLFATIEDRKGADPSTSWTAKLLSKGPEYICKKVGEEATETVIEAVAGRPDKIATESADLIYHLMVLWASTGVKPQDVWGVLQAREGTSGLAEKAARPKE
jgi:phosphoribosyl-ATP pyrophosphohydrolase